VKHFFIYILLIGFLNANFKMEINDLNNYYLEGGKLIYNISAKKHLLSLKKGDIPLFILNTNSYMLKHNFYKDGKFKYKHLDLNFKKGYILNHKVFMFDVNGTTKYGKIKAKEAIFNKDKIVFKKCEYNTPKRVYRRRELILKIRD